MRIPHPRLVALSSVAALALSACGVPSNLEPNDVVFVTGGLANEDATMRATAPVVLIRHPDVFEVIGDLFTIGYTLGAACIYQSVELCQPNLTAETDDAGAYEFITIGEETYGTFGQALTFTFAAANGGFGGGVSADFIINTTMLPLPTFQFWEPVLAATPDATGMLLTWDDLSDTHPYNPSSYTAFVREGTIDGPAIWIESAGSTNSISLDARKTSDMSGEFTIEAYGADSAPETDVAITWYSQGEAYPPGAAVPVSRGADCTVHREGGDVPGGGTAGSPCPITDGTMTTGLVPAMEPECMNEMGCPAMANN